MVHTQCPYWHFILVILTEPLVVWTIGYPYKWFLLDSWCCCLLVPTQLVVLISPYVVPTCSSVVLTSGS